MFFNIISLFNLFIEIFFYFLGENKMSSLGFVLMIVFVLAKCDTILNHTYTESFTFVDILNPYIIPKNGVIFMKKVIINPGVSIIFNGPMQLSDQGLDGCVYNYGTNKRGLSDEDNPIQISSFNISDDVSMLIDGGNINICNAVFENTFCLFDLLKGNTIYIKNSIFINVSCVTGHISASKFDNITDDVNVYGRVSNNYFNCPVYHRIIGGMEILSNDVYGCGIEVSLGVQGNSIEIRNNTIKNCFKAECVGIFVNGNDHGTVAIQFNSIINYVMGMVISNCDTCLQNVINSDISINYNNIINNFVNIYNNVTERVYVNASYNYYNANNDTIIRAKTCDTCDLFASKPNEGFVKWWPYSNDSFDTNTNDINKEYIDPKPPFMNYTCMKTYSNMYCLLDEPIILTPIQWPITLNPTNAPSIEPTIEPTLEPTQPPTYGPTSIPTMQPSIIPSNYPSSIPSNVPSNIPSLLPSDYPTILSKIPPKILYEKNELDCHNNTSLCSSYDCIILWYNILLFSSENEG